MARKPIKPNLQFNIKLNQEKWIIRLYTFRKFAKKWQNCVAITEYDHKLNSLYINFQGPNVSRDTIAHELMHAYLSYKDFDRLTPHTIEERFCEVIGKKYKVLYNITNKIYTIFKKGSSNAKKARSKEKN